MMAGVTRQQLRYFFSLHAECHLVIFDWLLMLSVIVSCILITVQCAGREHQEWCCGKKVLKWHQKMVLRQFWSKV